MTLCCVIYGCCLQVHQRSAERLLKLCCLNGGVFIKVGQHIGSLDYLLPKEYVNTMKVLHDKAPESSKEEILQVIKQDLGEQVTGRSAVLPHLALCVNETTV